jgi:hypothetical protein
MKLIAPALSLDVEPALDDVKKALSDIQNVKEEPSVVLQRTEMTFLQTDYTPEGYRLKCQFESNDRRFTAKRTFTYDEIVHAFELYFKGDTAWKKGIEFELTNQSGHAAFKIGFLIGNAVKIIGSMFKRK